MYKFFFNKLLTAVRSHYPPEKVIVALLLVDSTLPYAKKM